MLFVIGRFAAAIVATNRRSYPQRRDREHRSEDTEGNCWRQPSTEAPPQRQEHRNCEREADGSEQCGPAGTTYQRRAR
ncbi:MAG: hypothetical protein WEC75_09395 [Dehalococcoidia bacterium]